MVGLAASIGALLVSWTSLELPRPAFHPNDFDSLRLEIGEVADLAKGNATLIRHSEWWRINEKILTLETKLDDIDHAGVRFSIQQQIIELRRERSKIDAELGKTLDPGWQNQP